MNKPSLSISIVSHRQGNLIEPLLKDLSVADLSDFSEVEVIVTLNLPENEGFLSASDLKCRVVRNLRPRGFGANHNQAFAYSDCDYFLVLNPDIRLSSFSFGKLLDTKEDFGVLSPMVVSPTGKVEDSVRRYPSVLRILKRVMFSKRSPDYLKGSSKLISVDWIAGMFMFFPSESYKRVCGFDTAYFMYLEDADICRRLNQVQLPVLYDFNQKVIHDAQRSSFKNRQHLKWHLRSMVRFIFGF
jgi:GT2 family glycosyltransferase